MVTIYRNYVEARRKQVNTTSTTTGPTSTNTTLPFTLSELGLETAASDDYHRRVLQNSVSNGASKCTIKRNVTLHGGHLPNGPKRIKDIPTPAACCARCSFLEDCEAWSWSRVTKVCYPRAAEGWRSVSSKDHVSGFPKKNQPPASPPPPPKRRVTKPAKTPTASAASPSSSPSSSSSFSDSGTLLWQGKLTVGDHQLKRGFAGEVKQVVKANNKVVISDPTGLSTDPVIKTIYNQVRLFILVNSNCIIWINYCEFVFYSLQGCWSPQQACGGGALFYVYPVNKEASIGEAARLEYEVYFHDNFTFNKGGKLPGFMGGDPGCGGGADAGEKHCWSGK